MGNDRICLKWGTLKEWKLQTPAAQELAQKYLNLGSSMSAMTQKDTPEQKELLCQMIDASDVESVYLDWDSKHVSKDEAKAYIMGYGL